MIQFLASIAHKLSNISGANCVSCDKLNGNAIGVSYIMPFMVFYGKKSVKGELVEHRGHTSGPLRLNHRFLKLQNKKIHAIDCRNVLKTRHVGTTNFAAQSYGVRYEFSNNLNEKLQIHQNILLVW